MGSESCICWNFCQSQMAAMEASFFLSLQHYEIISLGREILPPEIKSYHENASNIFSTSDLTAQVWYKTTLTLSSWNSNSTVWHDQLFGNSQMLLWQNMNCNNFKNIGHISRTLKSPCLNIALQMCRNFIFSKTV